jgi:hypothetical protein
MVEGCVLVLMLDKRLSVCGHFSRSLSAVSFSGWALNGNGISDNEWLMPAAGAEDLIALETCHLLKKPQITF